jgi:hypothetical protein
MALIALIEGDNCVGANLERYEAEWGSGWQRKKKASISTLAATGALKKGQRAFCGECVTCYLDKKRVRRVRRC